MRIVMLSAIASLGALVGSMPVLAQDNANAPAAAQTQSAPIKVEADRKDDKEDMGDSERVICRKIETIGSRVHSQRVCATAAQWSAMRQEGREGVDRIQTQRSTNGG